MKGTGCYQMVAPFVVSGTIDDARNLCPSYGSCAHRAGFYGDVERTLREVFSSQSISRRRDGLHLRMSRHVVQRLREVVGTRDDAPLAHHHGAYGNLALAIGLFSLRQRFLHECFVGHRKGSYRASRLGVKVELMGSSSQAKRASSYLALRAWKLLNLIVHQRTDFLSVHDSFEVAHDVHVEHVDGQPVVAGHHRGGHVHDLEAAVIDLVVGDAVKLGGRGVLLGVGGVDAVHACALEHDVGLNLYASERRACVGGEVG